MAEIAWEWKPKLGLHHGVLDGTIRVAVFKVGSHYEWKVFTPDDSAIEQSGEKPNLKEAKRAAENWLNKPEPEHLQCCICGGEMVTRIEWRGPRYTFWVSHVPGAVELQVVGGRLFNLGYRCAACCDKHKAEQHDAQHA